MTLARTLFEFDDSYAREVPSLSVPWTAAPVPAPELLVLNEELAAELGVDAAALREPAGVSLLVGHGLPDGVTPVAQAYAGHQFGMYVPRLGDGRALLLGEVIDVHGRRRDVHLKGSGRTPFARGGDGMAAVGPMLREYLVGEAMHALGIPTTRALAVVATGERVVRETVLPGAVLVPGRGEPPAGGDVPVRGRVRRPGRAARTRRPRHRPPPPRGRRSANPYLELYRRVVEAQAGLVARWMLVGFVHGVMNTDNTTISGETIDYGPCAFMDAFDPATVFSSIDHGGRYAYGNQPAIAQWNLARLGETLLPLIDENADAAVEAATEVLASFAERYTRHWARGMAAKLGLRRDRTRSWRRTCWSCCAPSASTSPRSSASLAAGTARSCSPSRSRSTRGPRAARRCCRRTGPRSAAAMDRVNPVYIPRNHLVEEALTAATAGDLAPFQRLRGRRLRPFEERPGLEDYAEPAPAGCAPLRHVLRHLTYGVHVGRGRAGAW